MWSDFSFVILLLVVALASIEKRIAIFPEVSLRWLLEMDLAVID